jgi:hypothetical protein
MKSEFRHDQKYSDPEIDNLILEARAAIDNTDGAGI